MTETTRRLVRRVISTLAALGEMYVSPYAAPGETERIPDAGGPPGHEKEHRQWV
ncbi:hypothetical protein [Streptosporangium sp. KLBMP 9127]|nr:hypothetical protein [Streptosporangium sp. KLBMP 9127]